MLVQAIKGECGCTVNICICMDTHFSSSLPLDAVSATREAELVMRLRWALHEMRVLQALLAERALERGGCRGGGRGCGLRAGHSGPSLPRRGGPCWPWTRGPHGLWGRHRGGWGHVPGARGASTAWRAWCGEVFWNQGHCLISDILRQNRTNILSKNHGFFGGNSQCKNGFKCKL